jgi:NTP pyrophosphatase (non-canonical NTP hydrolase)
VNFDEYQAAVQAVAEPSDFDHELIPLLGVGAHVGSLLGGHQRYLRDAVVAGTSKTLLGRHLGEVLRWAALLALHHDLSLNSIALVNLDKIHQRAVDLGREGLPDFDEADGVDLEGYQSLAKLTDQEADDGLDPLGVSVPMLGLAGEAGSLLVALKKQYRERKRRSDWVEFVTVELGDMLWYIATVATHAGLRVVEIAAQDLRRADAARVELSHTLDKASLPVLDATFPETERFPRRLLLRFQEGSRDGRPEVTMSLMAADPNAFPDGPQERGEGKHQGYSTSALLGDKVTDNSKVPDAYRYHDAVHFGFLAVMGWSPNLRQLLHLKRKSDTEVDENEDGARAIFAEEGLAALLAKRADDSQRFANPRLVSEDLVEIMTTVLEDLEVSRMPAWLWRTAISQGFTAMRRLEEGKGGYLIADLDDRSLTYTKVPPRWLGSVEVKGLV